MKKLFERHPELLLAIIYLIVLSAAVLFTSVGFSQPPQSLWKIVTSKAGVNKDLVFISDKSLIEGSYVVNSDTIRHNSTTANNAALYAVAALSERLFDAVMLTPSPEGIIVKKKAQWQNLSFRYNPVLIRNNYVNVSATGWDRAWFHWHHIPTFGSGGSDFHKSWFLGLAKRYPQLAPTTGPVTDHTKPNITHPDFPRIIYDEWVLRGKPAECSLFEIDGTNYWWVQLHHPPPAYLNPGEVDRYLVALGSNIPRPGDGKKRNVNGVAYTLTDNLTLAQINLPRNNRYERGQERFNLSAYYIKMYKDVQAYFDAQGANHVRFRILGYSAYRCYPDNLRADLSRFDLYYTSPTASTWTMEEMYQDADQFLKWRQSGAKLIWRPNFIFRFNGRLLHPIVSTFLQITQPDGMQVAPYFRPSLPFGNAIDLYTTFRVMQGNSYDQAVSDFLLYAPANYKQWHDKAAAISLEIGKDEDDF